MKIKNAFQQLLRRRRAGQPGRITRIKAEIDETALKRVSSFFDASITYALHELFQNARRAGSLSIDITTTDAGSIVVTDSGRGITDADVLLSIGKSLWPD